MTPTAAKWDERVRDWRASGKTAEEFAVGQNFEATTLRYWASRLKTEASSKPTTPMARVVRQSRRGRDDAAGGEVEVIVGGARIVVRRGFDAELLRQVTAALGAAG